MLTTLMNPTVWLLAATVAVGIVGVVRRESARECVDSLVTYASAWPVLLVLVIMAGGGLSSRIVLGYVSPGAYAEEVVAARTFLESRKLYGADGRAELAEWLNDKPATTVPWTAIPGVTECQANAMRQRARFFTNHAHTPMLLLAGVPLIRFGGPVAVYGAFLLLSLAAIAAMAVVLLEHARVPWRSRRGVLLLAMLAGWQPVLAGVRQGDAVLASAALIALSWLMLARRPSPRVALAAALAACLALPAIGVLPALLRAAVRAGFAATALFAIALFATVAIGGGGVLPGFAQTIADTARTYSYSVTNYAVVGRISMTGQGAVVAIIGLAVAVLLSWWRGTTPDRAFGAFVTLGLLIAPVIWSQHLAIALVPVVVLFGRTWAEGSAAALAGWAALVLLLSLPDGSAAAISQFLSIPSPSGALMPVTSLGLIALWGSVTFGQPAERRQPRAAPVPAA
jgi:hypothetical protein